MVRFLNSIFAVHQVQVRDSLCLVFIKWNVAKDIICERIFLFIRVGSSC